MKRLKRWMVCYILPLGVLALFAWVIWQQCLINQRLEQQSQQLSSFGNQLNGLRTPKVIQDENKHYRQMAYLVLINRSDLDLGLAYLQVLAMNYAETKDMSHAGKVHTLKDQVKTLRGQVKARSEMITGLQTQLVKPRTEQANESKWLKPLKGWIHIEHHLGASGNVDPQQWRYWSTLEQARWYLIHGYYTEYLNTIQQLDNWVKIYAGDVVWKDTLKRLGEPFQDLDLSVISHDMSAQIIMQEKIIQRQRLSRRHAGENPREMVSREKTRAGLHVKPHSGVSA